MGQISQLAFSIRIQIGLKPESADGHRQECAMRSRWAIMLGKARLEASLPIDFGQILMGRPSYDCPLPVSSNGDAKWTRKSGKRSSRC